jgi:hypothetical protein
MAAGAQITQSRHEEVVTRNSDPGHMLCDCNEWNVNTFATNYWRASLVPAAAVIPAPIAYIKIVAVKASVVEFWLRYFVVWPFGQAIVLHTYRGLGLPKLALCYFEQIGVLQIG